MPSTRRKFLLTSGIGVTTALAGCTGGGSEETLADETKTIDEDRNYSWGFTIDEQRTIDYEFIVRSGPNVDVFVVTEDEYSHYTDRERFEYFGDTLDAGSGDDSVDLEAGEYRLVADNSDLGEATPPTNGVDDPAEVEVTATVS